MKLAVLLVPTELVSVTFCGPVGAFAAIVNVTVMLVPSLPMDALLAVIPAPENPTTTSLERLVPLMVTLNAVPRVPDVGVKLVIDGVPNTLNHRAALVPPGVVTVSCRHPVLAFDAIVNVAVSVVLLTTFRLDTVTPVPLKKVMLVAPETKFVPGIVIFTIWFKLPCCGFGGPVKVGAGGTFTVKLTPLLVPPDVVTVTVRPPGEAVPAMLKFAVIWVLLATFTLLTVTPAPLT